MQWLIIIPAFFILLCFIIFITKLSIIIMACYTPGEQRVFVQVRIWFIHYTFNVLEMLEKKKQKKETKKEPVPDENEEEKQTRFFSEWLEKLPELIKSMGDIHTISKDFLRKVKVKKFLWRSHLGTGDAASTGILAGYVWSVKGMVTGLISHYMKLVKTPELDVVPVFQGKITTTELECMISFRVGQALLAGLKLFRYIRKHRAVFVDEGATDIRG
ncbi:DUF2953 domain-containing protein [Ectobacillus panaciterrae]|uniref:DUF2953 domain-containing protein n=1 Tax=Ectobacillus panaciterrae TaxID=363872 RepID=UPI0003FCEDF2|nr:DUF2953 domain-containing protein [Ectobacillus panaciterrae]